MSVEAKRMAALRRSPAQCARGLRMSWSSNEAAAELVVDVNANDLVEGRLRLEAERERALRIEAAGPAGDHARNQRIRLAADARGDALAGDPAQRGQLFGDGAAHTGHVEVHARPEFAAVESRGVQEKADGRARAGVPVADALFHRQYRLLSRQGFADDRGKEAGCG